MSRSAASRGARGVNAPAGIRPPDSKRNSCLEAARPAPRQAVHRPAAQVGTTTPAQSKLLRAEVRRRSSAVVIPKGGLAATLKGRRGRRRSAASACTTTTRSPRNSARRLAARRGCSSTATTDAPRASSSRVIKPSPAPTSNTRSPATTPTASTVRRTPRLSSRCHPHVARSATEHHHHRHRPILTRSALHDKRIPGDARRRSRTCRRAVRCSCGLLPANRCHPSPATRRMVAFVGL
jgi:hypothetical protein